VENAGLSVLQDPEGRRLTGTHASFSHDQIAGFLASREAQHDRADWAAHRSSDGLFLGEAVVNDLDPDNESASGCVTRRSGTASDTMPWSCPSCARTGPPGRRSRC
jgi:hypothetical protein